MNAQTAATAIVMEEPAISGEAQKLVVEADGIKQVALAYTVDNHEMYEMAGKELVEIKRKRKSIEKMQEDMLSPFKEAKRKIEEGRKKIVDFFANPLNALAEAERTLTRACSGFLEAEDRKRRAAEERALEEQRKLQESAEKKAEKLEAKGQNGKAAEIRAAVPVVTAPVAQAPAKVSGLSFRDNHKARVVDPKAVPREYLMIDEQKLDKVAKATKGSIKIPGVEFYCEKVSVGR